jgi:hypothetical protein
MAREILAEVGEETAVPNSNPLDEPGTAAVEEEALVPAADAAE